MRPVVQGPLRHLLSPTGLPATGLLALSSLTFSACATQHDTSHVPRDEVSRQLIDATCWGTDLEGRYYEVKIPVDQYRKYSGMARSQRWVFHAFESSEFVTPNDPVIKELAEKLTRGAVSQEEKAQHLLRWVCGHVPYDRREARLFNDHARFPVETLYEGIGDCDDTTYLFASLALSVDIPVAIALYPDHFAAAVAGDFTGDCRMTNGCWYFMAETQDSSGTVQVGGPGIYPLRKAIKFTAITRQR